MGAILERSLEDMLRDKSTIFFWLDTGDKGNYGQFLLREAEEIRPNTSATMYVSGEDTLIPRYITAGDDFTLGQIVQSNGQVIVGVPDYVVNNLDVFTYLDLHSNEIIFSQEEIVDTKNYAEIQFLLNQQRFKEKTAPQVEPVSEPHDVEKDKLKPYEVKDSNYDKSFHIPGVIRVRVKGTTRNSLNISLEDGPVIIQADHEGGKIGDPHDKAFALRFLSPNLRAAHAMGAGLSWEDSLFVRYEARYEGDEIEIKASPTHSLVEIYLEDSPLIVQSNAIIGFEPGMKRIPLYRDAQWESIIAKEPLFNFSKVWFSHGGTLYLSANVASNKLQVLDEHNWMKRTNPKSSIGYSPDQIKKKIEWRPLKLERRVEEVYTHKGGDPGILIFGEGF